MTRTEPLPVGTRVTFTSYGTTYSATVTRDGGSGIVWVEVDGEGPIRDRWKHRTSLTVLAER